MSFKFVNRVLSSCLLFLSLSNANAGVNVSNMKTYVLRLSPGDDPKAKLQAFVNENNLKAAVILSAVGSLTKAVLRYANSDNPTTLTGHFEIVSLSGTLGSTSGSHLHLSVSDNTGKTLGGHLMDGSVIFTTLEISIGAMTDLEFKREVDPVSTYKELKVYPLNSK
ncbi:MAG: PPC domain-containing DNA-binding protein [Pseudomonadota bacterium]